MKSQIQCSEKGTKLDRQKGEPIRVLVISDLAEEYRLYQKPTTPEPDIEDWLHGFPLAWVETGSMGLALHRAPVYVEIKAGVEPIKVHQCHWKLKGA